MARSIGGTPAAVLAGSVIIACGLYFGLRARPLAAPPTSAGGTASEASVVVPSGSPVLQGTPSSPQPPASLPAAVVLAQAGAAPAGAPDVNRDVLAALESQRATLASTCWKPATAGQSKPASATYDFDLAFDEAGHEVARGISGREGASTELTQCLNRHSPGLVIPARGGRVHSRVRFTLP